ncbi:hypothetical protein QBZ16_001753 [Prototheca wickerhamii]|uniref:Coenzyme Q-binding protein COQ10 START domain-containing protein n=1 Tax=Prototheca wickerhamii TaxID=3111 RepID=A0AAD9MIU6_PROWI|nr:hypothetical protein QBZ16_001753 [Prototheca wickerhamii]
MAVFGKFFAFGAGAVFFGVALRSLDGLSYYFDEKREEQMYQADLRKRAIQAAGERLLRPFMGFSSPFQPPPAKTFRDFKVMGYLPEQIYDVVADIDNYDRFVPWCIQSRIVSQSAPGTVDAELTVGFHMISERYGYISHVTFHPGNSIRSRVGSSALFHHLNNTWEFAPGPRPGTTALTFYVDFAFKVCFALGRPMVGALLS